jgi:hypothetical protein
VQRFVDHFLSFCSFSFGHCIICPSSNYDFWISLWNLYSCIKPKFRLEPYLLKLTAINRVYICKLRTCNLTLPFETGRWRNIPSYGRYCTLYEDQLVGNEFHYLFVCKNATLVQMRSKYIPTYFIGVPANHKMYGLLSHCNIPLLNRLSLYVRQTSPLFWNMSVTSMPLRDQFVMTTWKINKISTCWSRDITRPVISISWNFWIKYFHLILTKINCITLKIRSKADFKSKSQNIWQQIILFSSTVMQMICAWHMILTLSGRLSLMRNVQLMKKKLYIFRVYHIRIIAPTNWFTRHETDVFLNNHCQECVRAYLNIHDCLSFLHGVMTGNHRNKTTES